MVTVSVLDSCVLMDTWFSHAILHIQLFQNIKFDGQSVVHVDGLSKETRLDTIRIRTTFTRQRDN